MLKVTGYLRLTKDVEIKIVSTGKKVANTSGANNRGTADNRITDFYELIGWENAADAMEGLKKGDLVHVSGILQIRPWKDKNDNERKTEEIVVESITRANVKPKTDGDAAPAKAPAKAAKTTTPKAPATEQEEDDENEIFQAIDEDDIPF